MAKKAKATVRRKAVATKSENGQPNLLPSGRAVLQEIYAEHTRARPKEHFHPTEWANSPAHFAEESLKCIEVGDVDGAVFWAMEAAVAHWGNQFIGRTENL